MGKTKKQQLYTTLVAPRNKRTHPLTTIKLELILEIS